MKTFSEFLADSHKEELNESREQYLNKIKGVVEKDQNFKNFKIKLNSDKNLELDPTPVFKTIYPVIYFFSSSNSVEFNFDHIKILSWLDQGDSSKFAKRYEQLAKLYKYCEKIAKDNWVL